MRGGLKSFLTDQSGQATTEYIILLSVCVVVAGQLARTILAALDRGILRLGGQLEKDLKTGRAPLGIWK
jgi:hypothetical protein